MATRPTALSLFTILALTMLASGGSRASDFDEGSLAGRFSFVSSVRGEHTVAGFNLNVLGTLAFDGEGGVTGSQYIEGAALTPYGPVHIDQDPAHQDLVGTYTLDSNGHGTMRLVTTGELPGWWDWPPYEYQVQDVWDVRFVFNGSRVDAWLSGHVKIVQFSSSGDVVEETETYLRGSMTARAARCDSVQVPPGLRPVYDFVPGRR